jgi:hypothetical protein
MRPSSCTLPIAAAAIVGIVLALAVSPVHALMAGQAPDTPALRVEAIGPVSPWRATVSVVVGSAAYSGVVIAPRFVLTAAHVVGGASPQDVRAVLNLAPGAQTSITAESIVRFPTANFPYDDLAVIRLQSPVPAEVLIHPVREAPLEAGQQVTLVGHGASGNGNVGVSVPGSSSVRRVGRNVVDSIRDTTDDSGRTSAFFLFDFDGPSGNGSLGAGTLGNAVETGAAGGDSGSPVFADIDGATWLVGLTTFVASTAQGAPVDYRFGTLGGGMVLSHPRFMAWLRTVTGNTLVTTPADTDVPLPPWALGALAAALTATLMRARQASGTGSRRS